MVVGIKESMELLEGVKVVGVIVKKALADGKVNLADLPLLMGAVPKLSLILEASKGTELIVAEIKDMDAAELNQLGAKVLEVIAAIKAA